MSPFRHLHLLPPSEGVQPELQEPLRFVFLGGNQPDDVLIQALRYELLLHVCNKTVFILLFRKFFNYIVFFHKS